MENGSEYSKRDCKPKSSSVVPGGIQIIEIERKLLGSSQMNCGDAGELQRDRKLTEMLIATVNRNGPPILGYDERLN